MAERTRNPLEAGEYASGPRHEHAIAECSRLLLGGRAPEGLALAGALTSLRDALCCGRVYVFENFLDDEKGLCCRKTSEACAEGVEPHIDNPALQSLPYFPLFRHWADMLARGETVAGPLEDFPEAERVFLAEYGVKSMLLVPVFVGGQWHGLLGAHDVSEGRRWSGEETSLLSIAAEMLGAALGRRRSSEEISRGRELLDLALEGAEIALWELRLKSRELTIHEHKGLGAPPREHARVPLDRWEDRINPADMIGLRRTLKEHIEGEADIFETEVRFQNDDESWAWHYIRGKAVEFSPEGEPLRLAGTALDVTGRKRAEEALAASEERLRSLFAGLPVPTGIFERHTDDLRLIDFNNAVIEQAEGDARQFMGKWASEIFAHDPELIGLFRRAARGERIEKEVRYLTVSGQAEKYISLRLSPAPPDLVLAQAEDITDRKRTERITSLQRDLGLTLGGDISLDKAMRRALDTTIEISGAIGGGVYLFNEEGDLVLMHHRGLSDGFVDEAKLVPRESYWGERVRKGGSLYSDIEGEFEYKERLEGEGAGFLAVIPIHHRGRVIGSINLGARDGKKFVTEVKDGLESVASMLGGFVARHEADQALRAGMDKYRTLFDRSPDFIAIFDSEGTAVDVNKAVADFLGLEKDQVIGRNYSDFGVLPSEDIGRYRQMQQEDYGEGEVRNVLVPIYSAAGELHYFESYATKIPGEGLLQVIARDVTQRVTVERKLKESEEKLRAQYRAVPVPTLTFQKRGSDFVLVDFNDAAREFTGGAAERYRGARLSNFQDIFPEAVGEIRRCFDERSAGHKEVPVALGGGNGTSYFSLRIAYVPPDQVLVHGEDITDRRRWEESLRESEAKWRSLTENAPDLIITTDLEGKILFNNRRPRSGPHAEVTGRNILGMLDPREADALLDQMDIVIDKGHDVSYEIEGGHGLEPGYYSVRIGPVKDGESVVGLTMIFTDISDRKHVQDQLEGYRDRLEELVYERTVELERANEELSQYAYAVSHDLKAPLRAIHHYADFLAEELEAADNPEVDKYLGGLAKAVRQGENLVADLLELSRIGRGPDSAEIIYLGEFLRELAASMNLGPDVEIEIAEKWPRVMAEPSNLRQLFLNLIGNAIKFNESDIKRVEISWRKSGGDHIEICVEDNGIGIDQRYHRQIFKVFQRLHTAQEYEGTGIGLAIVRKAASKMLGYVHLESEPGEGSRFYVTLPLTGGGQY